MWQIAHTPNHLCWSCIKFDDVTIRITDRKNVLYRLLDFKCINQNFFKHAEWITLRMFFVVAEVTLNIRSQSSITTSQRRLFSSTTRLKPQFRPSSLESFFFHCPLSSGLRLFFQALFVPLYIPRQLTSAWHTFSA